MSAIALSVGAVLVLLGIFLFFYAADSRQRTALSLLVNRIVELERQAALVSGAVVPISAAFQITLIRDLTHFHTPEMDALMVKLGPPLALSEEEALRLEHLLSERAKDMGLEISDAERDAAAMLPLVMRRVKADIGRTGIAAEPLVHILVTPHDERKPEKEEP
jgi:hypothetical protein